ncbi:PASTA domain-containing protein [Kitasatospora sp. NPDC054939]
MRLFCRLCGNRTDGRERFGSYCPGGRCGTDLRAGPAGGVQAWCVPEQQFGEPGRTALVRLRVRNAGDRPDSYRLEPLEPVDGRLEFDERLLARPLAPGQEREVELRCTPPRDHLGGGLDAASRFGVPGAEAAGLVNGVAGARFGVALRVVSATAGQGAACAAFAIDLPDRPDLDLDLDRDRDHDRGAGRRPSRSAPRPTPRSGGAGRSGLLLGVVVVLIAAATALVLVLGLGTGVGGSGSGGSGSGGSGGGEARPPVTGPGGPSTSPSPVKPGNGVSPGTGVNPGNGVNPGSGNGGRGGGSPSPSAALIIVPEVVGLTREAATAKLRALGLTVAGERVEVGRAPENQVIGANPAAGARVARGSEVLLRLSDGRAELPRVAGLSSADAELLLKKAHFTNVTLQKEESRTLPEGAATRTDPTVGTVHPLTAPVTLWIALKPRLR